MPLDAEEGKLPDLCGERIEVGGAPLGLVRSGMVRIVGEVHPTLMQAIVPVLMDGGSRIDRVVVGNGPLFQGAIFKQAGCDTDHGGAGRSGYGKGLDQRVEFQGQESGMFQLIRRFAHRR